MEPETTAFAHRDQLFTLEHAVNVDPVASIVEKDVAHRWINGSWELVHRWGSGRV
jgi:hypothetical protein